jgi:hypothetical protein
MRAPALCDYEGEAHALVCAPQSVTRALGGHGAGVFCTGPARKPRTMLGEAAGLAVRRDWKGSAAGCSGRSAGCENVVVAVVRHTATLGPDGDLRIPREIREAAKVVDGEQLTIEVGDKAAIVIRHADRPGDDVADALSRAAELRARVAETRSPVELVRDGRDELEGRGNVSA